MTRENKLALVVGFGLILFVGILISDHFSVVRTQHAANLTGAIEDPLLPAVQPVNLIDLSPETPQTPKLEPVAEAVPNATVEGSGTVAGARPTDVVQLDTQAAGSIFVAAGETQPLTDEATPPGFVAVESQPEIPLGQLLHTVKEGETLYGICREHFGDTSKVQAIADYNNLDDAASIRVGQRLRMPHDANGRSQSSSSSTKPASKSAKVTYTVKAGDSLSQIAERFMGSKGKWKKLYDMNRNVIDDPDNLKVGTVLRVS
jgi:nucleoid-associated protein YgaU